MLVHACASRSSISPCPALLQWSLLAGSLGCPCLCDSFAAGGTMHRSPAPTAAACTRFCKVLL